MLKKIIFLFFLLISKAHAFDATGWNYFVPISVNGSIHSTAIVDINFRNLLSSLNDSSNLDINSIRVVRPNGTLVINQEYIDSIFNNNTDDLNNNRGQVRFLLEDDGNNTYLLYFDSLNNGSKPVNTSNLINGVFEFGNSGQRNIDGWTSSAAENYDAQLRPSETLTVSSGSATVPHQVNGNPETGNFSYLIGARTSNDNNNSQATRIFRTIRVPSTNPGVLNFSYRIHGWDSAVNGNTTQWDFFIARVIVGSNITNIVGPATNNYTNFPFSPNYGLELVSNSRSGYGRYNGFDCDIQNRRRRQGNNPIMTIPCGGEVWLTPTLNLAEFAGQTILLEFITFHTETYKTWVHLDNVVWSAINGVVGTPSKTVTIPSIFDVIEPSSNNPIWINNNRRPIYSKIANIPFSLDIVALKNDNSLENNFESNSVLFEIYNNNNSCSQLVNPIYSQTFSFPKGIGRYTLRNININQAHRNLIVKITDTINNISSCSSDLFSIRPNNITISVLGNNFNAPHNSFDLMLTDINGQNSNSTNFIGAGQPFSIIINTNTVNYNNTFQLDSNLIDWPNVPPGAIPYSTQMGVGNLLIQNNNPANSANGNNATINASYTEVGYFRFLQGSIHDRTWTSIDIINGDCNLNSSNSLSNNRYGCYLENTQTNHIGRFVPTNFSQSTTLATNLTTRRESANSCTPQRYIYFGEPILTETHIEARNSLNQVTRNYHGSFARVSGVNLHAKTNTTIYDNRINLNSSNTISVNQGILNYSSNFFVQRAPSFSLLLPPDNPTNITLGSTLNELDNIQIINGTYTAPNISPNTGIEYGNYNFIFGRIRLINIKGSDLVAHRIPIHIEYYQNGSWLTNIDDTCTRLHEANFSTNNFIGQIQANEISFSYPNIGLNIQNGKGYIILNKPTGGDGQYVGSFRLNYNINSSIMNKNYLGTKTTSSNLYNENPSSLISIGRVNRNRIILLKKNL